MDATDIIFKKKPSEKAPVWVETVHGLEKVNKRLQEYSSNSSDEYFVFDVSHARVLDISAKAKSA